MRNTSESSSQMSRWIAGALLFALVVAGAFYVLPGLWNHRMANPLVTIAPSVTVPPAKIQPNTVAPAVSTQSARTPHSAAVAPKSPSTNSSMQNSQAASALEKLKVLAAKKKTSDPNEFRMEPDKGSSEEGGETGEDPKLRADYFYSQRAYPNAQTPAGALQQSRQQLDTMIAQERAAGILPAEDTAPPPVSFPGPANWTNLGPQPVTNGLGGANFGNPAATGRVNAIAVDPTTTTPGSQVVYLGAATGGVWKSMDGGASWNTIFDQNNSLAIGGIAIAPTDSNTIYVGTGELNFSGDSYYGAGIYKSTNGGNTWTQQCGPAGTFCAPVGSFPFQGGGFIIGRIAVSPANASIALAAVRDAGNGALSGIYRTTDGGTTWTLVPTASGSAGNSIVWNPSDSNTVYASLGQTGANAGVFKSTDGGVTFSKLTGNGAIGNNLPTTNLGRHEIAIAPSNPSTLYVAINNINTSSLLGLAKSTDAGATWSFTLPGTLPSLPNFCNGQCWYDMSLAVLPNDPNTLVVGGSAFTNNSSTDFRTTDGGTTWTDITNGSTAVRPHVDTHVMTFAATTGGFRLYTGNDGGIWFTDNPSAATVTWQAGNNANLTITQFYPGHAVSPSDENISFGGTQDNGTEKYSGVLAWDHVACGDGAWAAIDPNLPTIVYANCQNIAIQRSLGDGVASTFASITNQLGSSGDRSLFIPPLVQDRNQSGRLYFGTFRVWQSIDYGNNWAAISPDLSAGSGDVTSVSPSEVNNNVVYATTSDGRVWRTADAQDGPTAAWSNLTKAPLPGRYATMVKADDISVDTAYLAYSGFNGFGGDTVGHIFKTTNGGNTWTDISGTAAGALPNTPVNDIVYVDISPLGFTALFIATDVGVFECSDPTAATPCQTWTPVGSGLPKVPVVGLAYRENSAMLRAITHGRGVWAMETPGVNAAGLLLLTSISPSSRPLGSGSFTMNLDGNDFGVGVPPGTPPVILVDGVDPGVTGLTFTANHITATIPASVTATPGAHQIRISQPGHAALPNNPTDKLIFSVPGPAPTLTQISPTVVATGAPGFTMTLTGTNFVCSGFPSNSIVEFGANVLNVNTCSTTSLTVNVSSQMLTNPASFVVKVFDPGPGGGLSGGQTFTVGGTTGNDNFANATIISTLPFSDSQSIGADTTEIGEPVPSSLCIRALAAQSASTHSMWYSYTPLSSGVVSFSSPGETAVGIIQVVTGSALGALTPVAGGCSLDIKSAFLVSGAAATVKVSAGVTYHIMVSDYSGAGGTAVLNAAAATAPVNDDFANAITVSTVGFGDTKATTGATTEVGEPIPAPAPVCTSQEAVSTHSVWYRYTPGSSGTAVFNTIGSSTDSIIQVVTGSLGSFAAVTGGCADNGAQGVGETVTFSVTSGTTYFIMVSDWNGIGGTSVLNFASGPAPTVGGTPDMTITKSHTGNFTQGQIGATYTVTATNSGTASTTGTVTVVDTLPTGLTATALSGTGWTCTLGTLTCTRSDALATSTSYPAITLTVTVANNAAASVTNNVTVSGGGETNAANDTATDPTTVTQVADLTIVKSHTGNFTQGQVGATYTITVTNSGVGPTSGTVTMVDTLPAGLTATAENGTGWTCVLGTLTCTRSDVLAASSSYPAITLTVTVANSAAASVTNNVTVSGGGELNVANDSATNPTTVIQVADLTVGSTHVGNFSQGQTAATYTLTASNGGPGPTSGTVTVVDTLPAGLTASAMSGTGWTCTFGTGTCTRSDVLAAASSYPAITLTVNVALSAANGTNSVTVSGGGEINTANDTGSDPTIITIVSPDMTITKSHVGSFTQGQVGATYTITATNSGGAATTAAVTVADTLPAGLTATALTGTGWTCTLGTVSCTRADALAAAASYPAITLTVTVANNAAASVTNSVTVSGGGETNVTNDTALDPTTVVQVADLTIVKSHVGNFVQGQVGATYSIAVGNAGPGPTSGTVTVVDTLPAGLTATALTGTGWTCTLGTLTCTRADVLAAAGNYPVITLTVTVANGAAASVTNTATVSGGGEINAANDVSNDVTTITQAPDLTIVKSHVGNFTQGQSGATYTITVTNSGPGPTTGTVTVVDTLPAGLTATGMLGTNWICTLGTLTCTNANPLAPAASYAPITLTVLVASNAAASITNTATVSGGGEIVTANDTATDATTVVQLADMTITKSHTGNLTQGQVGATYTLTATNSGSGATSGTVTVTDTLPAGLTATAMTGTGWTCTLGTLTCTRSDVLAPAGSYPAITLAVTVANNAAASVTNSATVSGGGEIIVANDSVNDVTTIVQLADMTITKTHTGNFSQGQVGATYTITATNSGPGPTSGTVTVVDTLPAGLTATAMTGTGWTCTLGTLTCTRSDVLAAAASYPAITLTVTVANNAAASVTNSVGISGGGELNVANDTASDVTTIALASDLSITKTHVGNFTQGQVGATYSINVGNAGPGPTNGTVTVVDTMPAGLTATALAGTGWSCTLGTLTCTRADVLAVAGSYPAITATVTVANGAAASVTNTATVSGGGELNLANDTASDSTTVIQVADLTLAKTHVGNFTQGQAGATYTITVTNSGPGPTNGLVTVVDALPAGLTATAETGTGWTCVLGTLTCTRADALASAGSYPAITLTVNVANNAAASLTNTATVSGGGELNLANDVSANATTITQLADLTITKTHAGSFTLGQTGATYTITVANSGAGATSGTVTVVDTLPVGLTATALTGTGWTCSLGTLTCTRSDVLAAAASYPAITLTVTVGTTPGSVTNTATVSGGGEIITTNDTANDLTALVQDFSETGPGSPVTVTAGQTAMYTITVTPGPGGFSNAITFSATGLPAAATATFAPLSVTPGGSPASTTLSVATTLRSTFPGAAPPNPWKVRPFALWSFAFATILLSLILFGKTERKRRLTPVMFVAVALLLGIGVTGCSNMSGGTPTGTSTITVTATSGAVVHTTTVTLTVQ